MTEHTMPMLTDSEREELIELARNVISTCEKDDEKHRSAEIKIFEIALAALTAEPIAWRHDNGPFGKVSTCSPKAADSWRDIGFLVTPLYTVPPVPALKLPDEKEQEVMSIYGDGLQDGFNQCLAEVRALNGVTE